MLGTLSEINDTSTYAATMDGQHMQVVHDVSEIVPRDAPVSSHHTQSILRLNMVIRIRPITTDENFTT